MAPGALILAQSDGRPHAAGNATKVPKLATPPGRSISIGSLNCNATEKDSEDVGTPRYEAILSLQEPEPHEFWQDAQSVPPFSAPATPIGTPTPPNTNKPAVTATPTPRVPKSSLGKNVPKSTKSTPAESKYDKYYHQTLNLICTKSLLVYGASLVKIYNLR